jgi:hypothetical protein
LQNNDCIARMVHASHELFSSLPKALLLRQALFRYPCSKLAARPYDVELPCRSGWLTTLGNPRRSLPSCYRGAVRRPHRRGAIHEAPEPRAKHESGWMLVLALGQSRPGSGEPSAEDTAGRLCSGVVSSTLTGPQTVPARPTWPRREKSTDQNAALKAS